MFPFVLLCFFFALGYHGRPGCLPNPRTSMFHRPPCSLTFPCSFSLAKPPRPSKRPPAATCSSRCSPPPALRNSPRVCSFLPAAASAHAPDRIVFRRRLACSFALFFSGCLGVCAASHGCGRCRGGVVKRVKEAFRGAVGCKLFGFWGAQGETALDEAGRGRCERREEDAREGIEMRGAEVKVFTVFATTPFNN